MKVSKAVQKIMTSPVLISDSNGVWWGPTNKALALDNPCVSKTNTELWGGKARVAKLTTSTKNGCLAMTIGPEEDIELYDREQA